MPAQDDAGVVQQARTRARRRLIGAAVLLGVGVIGFPLLFETQPRPIALDIPIEIPRKEGAPPLVTPQSKAKAVGAVVSEPRGRESGAASASASTPKPTPTPAATPAQATAAPPARAAAAASPAAKRVAATPPAPTPTQAQIAAQPAAQPATQPATISPAASGAAASTRYIIQVGAFADDAGARQARARVEKLGLKTYTQVVQTEAGRRIRVRIGPFATRADTDKAAAALRADNLPAAVMVL